MKNLPVEGRTQFQDAFFIEMNPVPILLQMIWQHFDDQIWPIYSPYTPGKLTAGISN